MGIPLHRMPQVRRFYGKDVEEETKIDFATEEYIPINHHVIAARITAENPDEGFKPTSGTSLPQNQTRFSTRLPSSLGKRFIALRMR
jgi:biotin carboxylase